MQVYMVAASWQLGAVVEIWAREIGRPQLGGKKATAASRPPSGRRQLATVVANLVAQASGE